MSSEGGHVTLESDSQKTLEGDPGMNGRYAWHERKTLEKRSLKVLGIGLPNAGVKERRRWCGKNSVIVLMYPVGVFVCGVRRGRAVGWQERGSRKGHLRARGGFVS